MLQEILARVYFGNSVETYAKAAVAVAGGLFAVWLVKLVVLKRLRAWSVKTETTIDDFIIDAIESYLVPVIYFAVFYLGLNGLNLNPAITKALSALASILVTVMGIRFINSLIKFALFDVYLKKRQDAATISNRFQSLMPALSILIWVIGCIFLLDNLGFKVSAIMAGLGIGGVAVALAASAVLGDLFAYFVIMFDRPFVIGDFIILGDFMGSVEHIGIKTTRLRSLGGELLVFSNKDLTDSRVRNYKIMDRRRIVFTLGVTYNTPLEKLKQVPPLIESIIKSSAETAFDRAHFFSYAASSLSIEVVYYVLSPDYNKYMDIQQAINFSIKEEFEKRGIEFAFPTQTVYLQPSQPANV